MKKGERFPSPLPAADAAISCSEGRQSALAGAPAPRDLTVDEADAVGTPPIAGIAVACAPRAGEIADEVVDDAFFLKPLLSRLLAEAVTLRHAFPPKQPGAARASGFSKNRGATLHRTGNAV